MDRGLESMDSRSPSYESSGIRNNRVGEMRRSLSPISSRSPNLGRDRSGSIDLDKSRNKKPLIVQAPPPGLSKYTLSSLTSTGAFRKQGGLNVARPSSGNRNRDDQRQTNLVEKENEEREISGTHTPIRGERTNRSLSKVSQRQSDSMDIEETGTNVEDLENNGSERDGVDLLVSNPKRKSKGGKLVYIYE